jgi:N-acetylglucosamine-6-phosphate deacetylase
MSGQYMDPLTVACPFCKTRAAYPLKELENYRVVCIHCKKSLVQVSRKMDQSQHGHSTELWGYWLKLDLFDDYILDESLTDEEFDNLKTLAELITLLNRFDPSVSLESLSNHPKLSSAIKILGNQPADNISLNDLAILQTALKKIPFNQFALVGARIFTGDIFLDNHALIVNGDIIESIIPVQDLPGNIQQIPLADGILAPGFIDLQVNGGGGEFFTQNTSLSAIKTMLDAHRKFGTTSLLPTLISSSEDIHHKAVNSVITAMHAGFSGVLGVHIEGPFFAVNKRGAHAEKFIREINSADIDWLDAITKNTDLKILLTLAPEIIPPGVIQQLSQKGILVFAGHTDATYEQIQNAIMEGLCGFTHLYNAMRNSSAREPGVVGAALENQQTWCGIIIDGHHVHTASARIAYAAKPERIFLVSDAMATVGSTEKSFQLYDEKINESQTASTACLINQEGKLAGSAIGLIDAVKLNTQWVGVDLAESLRMASLYPARCLKLDHQLGKIQSGYRADLVHFTEDFQVTSTWVAGDWMVHE